MNNAYFISEQLYTKIKEIGYDVPCIEHYNTPLIDQVLDWFLRQGYLLNCYMHEMYKMDAWEAQVTKGSKNQLLFDSCTVGFLTRQAAQICSINIAIRNYKDA
jgi:hypothetical protein